MKMVLASALVTFERVQPQQKKHPAMGRKRAYSEGRSRQEKVSKGLPTKLTPTRNSFMTRCKAANLKRLAIDRFGPFTGSRASDASENFFDAP